MQWEEKATLAKDEYLAEKKRWLECRSGAYCVCACESHHIPRDSVLDDLPAALVCVAFAGAHYLGGPSFPSEELALYPLTGCVRGCSANLCAPFDGSANGALAPWC